MTRNTWIDLSAMAKPGRFPAISRWLRDNQAGYRLHRTQAGRLKAISRWSSSAQAIPHILNVPRPSPHQAGGLEAISRWLRSMATTPPEPMACLARIPQGCQRARFGAVVAMIWERLRSLRDRIIYGRIVRGWRWAQPPANGWHPSGMNVQRSAAEIGQQSAAQLSWFKTEYALSGIEKPMGVAEYQLLRALPKPLDTCLPTIEELETELSRGLDQEAQP
jgi:hypothetical protein